MERCLLSSLHSTLGIKQLKQIHALIVTEYHALVSPFVHRLINLSIVDYAQKVFDIIPQPEPWLCNTFISAYSKLSFNREAVDMFLLMHRKDVQLSGFSIAPAIKSCSTLLAFELGRQVHSLVIRHGLDELDLHVQTALMSFYAKSGDLGSARMVFDVMRDKDPISYNCMISAYSKSGEALSARRLFDEMGERTIVSWNSIISCYVHNGELNEAMRMFDTMQNYGFRPSKYTLVTLLSICAKSNNLEMGLKVKDYIYENHHMLSNMIVVTALVEMLVKCGAVDEARQEFNMMRNKDIVAWGAMVTGYVQNGRPNEALELFEEMKSTGVKPNEVTIVSVLSACGELGSMEAAERIRTYTENEGLDLSVYVASSLLTMYFRNGRIEKAFEVFDKTKMKDLVFWNSMIKGLAINGYAREAIDLHKQMTKSGIKPNEITFVELLTASAHAGEVDLGLSVFLSMKAVHRINPEVEHYACIVDLLCRKGRLNEAYDYICTMEMEPNNVIWGTLLSACRIYLNPELADIAVKKLEMIDSKHSGNYVLLSNTYADSGRWQEALRVRNYMSGKKVQKTAAYSWIELEDGVHKFLVSDVSHPRSDEIFSIIDELFVQSALDETDMYCHPYS